MAMDMDLSETFKMFDTDGDGTVDLKEAKQARFWPCWWEWWPKPWLFMVIRGCYTSQFIHIQYKTI